MLVGCLSRAVPSSLIDSPPRHAQSRDATAFRTADFPAEGCVVVNYIGTCLHNGMREREGGGGGGRRKREGEGES